MNVQTYIGKGSGKMHLEVNGVTLATEGDLCRDPYLRSEGVYRWTRESLTRAANSITSKV